MKHGITVCKTCRPTFLFLPDTKPVLLRDCDSKNRSEEISVAPDREILARMNSNAFRKAFWQLSIILEQEQQCGNVALVIRVGRTLAYAKIVSTGGGLQHWFLTQSLFGQTFKELLYFQWWPLH